MKKTMSFNEQTREYFSDADENALSIIMSLEGQILSMSRGKDSSHRFVMLQLTQYLDKCANKELIMPKYVTVDDCCTMRDSIEKTFAAFDQTVVVLQDVKHLINRLIEQLLKTHKEYTSCCSEIHRAIVGSKQPFQSSNGKSIMYPSKLDNGDVIIRRVNGVIAHFYKEGWGGVFKTEFSAAWVRQQVHFTKGCCNDIVINNKHYYEAETGIFKLYRGTNRNESCHSKINHAIPKWCSVPLSESVLIAFKFNWNWKRSHGGANIVCGTDTSCVSVGSIRLLKGLKSLNDNSLSFTAPFPSAKTIQTISSSNTVKKCGTLSLMNGSHMSSLTMKIIKRNLVTNDDSMITKKMRNNWTMGDSELISNLVTSVPKLRNKLINWNEITAMYNDEMKQQTSSNLIKSHYYNNLLHDQKSNNSNNSTVNSNTRAISSNIGATSYYLQNVDNVCSDRSNDQSTDTITGSFDNHHIIRENSTGSIIDNNIMNMNTFSSETNTSTITNHTNNSEKTLECAPKGTTFSTPEHDILKNIIIATTSESEKNIKWGNVHYKYLTNAKEYLSLNPSHKVYTRTKNQLEEHYKSVIKKELVNTANNRNGSGKGKNNTNSNSNNNIFNNNTTTIANNTIDNGAVNNNNANSNNA